MDIDWSKAPEGATHFGPAVEGKWLACWHKNIGGQWLGWLADGDTRWGVAGNTEERVKQFISRPYPWNGEGLPPVGTVCEFAGGTPCPEDPFDKDLKEGMKVKIIAHFGCGDFTLAAFTFDPENPDRGMVQVEQGNFGCFRPNRTPEQIAAEERDKASVELAGILAGHDQHIAVRDIELAKYLYDIGYRKQVAP
jgi:hypothetical protein